MFFALCFSAEAQLSGKVPRIGVLWPTAPPDPLFDAFKQGLGEVGYVQAQHIALDERCAEGVLERLASVAAELLRVGIKVTVPRETTPTPAAKPGTKTIPIVMSLASPPEASGLVASLAPPPGNITGLSNLAPDLAAKRLELL